MATGNTTQFIRYVPSPKPDLTGKTITAWVYVESTPSTLQVSVFANDVQPNNTFKSGTAITVQPGDAPAWHQVSYTVEVAATSWNPTMINQFGVQVVAPTGMTGFQGTLGTTVVDVDDVVVQ